MVINVGEASNRMKICQAAKINPMRGREKANLRRFRYVEESLLERRTSPKSEFNASAPRGASPES